jgi:cystathionine beta-lyase
MGKDKIKTKLIHSGIDTIKNYGSLSDPVYKSSTLIFKNYKEYILAKKNKFSKPYYGRLGSYNTKSLEKIISELYQSESCVVTSSGLSAITLTLLSFLDKNSECLITQNCYEPVYNFATQDLAKFGVKIKFFENNNIKKITKLITKRTKIIYLESPSSMNYEVEDLEKVTKIAKQKNIITVFDNTWATFLGFNPFRWGVDIVIESATKYISGHSDNFCGLVACSYNNYLKIKSTATKFGDYVHSESCVTAIRGLRTLETRMNQHSKNAKLIYNFLNKSKIVRDIIFLPDKKNKNHKLWKKYFCLSNGLITFSILKKNNISDFLDNLKIFKIGFSWGGFESLILPIKALSPIKKYSKNSVFWFRIHVGLESSGDLIKDLKKGFYEYEK